ncbi:hypothetical protein [Nioella aestuarii]|uniref:hypothetical protein n=1 Tax=Nioella aestuarii TaxID=1662864 RepID=UPI003D7F9F1B
MTRSSCSVGLVATVLCLGLGVFFLNAPKALAQTASCPPELIGDGVCNEMGIGRGHCEHGSDSADCAQWYEDPNACWNAGDGICDEPGIGTGLCPAGTDSFDCDGPPGGPDSCPYANDGSCNEPGFITEDTPWFLGQILCAPGTDTTDCDDARLNSCSNAYDGYCDPGIGRGGECEPGTDTFDCNELVQRDTCATANNGSCEEPDLGDGSCAFSTDSSDCRTPRQRIWAESCPWSDNGVCDELGRGATGLCWPGTDQFDCWAATAAIHAPLGGLNSCIYSFDLICDTTLNPGGNSLCGSAGDQFDCEVEGAATGGVNACDTARNGVCDEAQIGTGTCDALTDTADCQPVREANTCDTAFDRRCDELRIGRRLCPVIGPTGLGYSCEEIFTEDQVCAPYTDSADCEHLRGTPGDLNSCSLSFDGICDEPQNGTGLCFENTDAMDCSMTNGGTAGTDSK